MYQQHYQQPYNRPPMRSAIPKVMGILMIVFGSLGVLGALLGSIMPQDPKLAHLPAWQEYQRIAHLMGYIGIPVSAFQLIVGLICTGYKKTAPKMAMIYGGLSMAHTIANAVVMWGFAKPALNAALNQSGDRAMQDIMGMAVNFGLVLGTILALVWPTLVLILMSRPRAKAACVN
jgi:hypothetical protein